MKVRIVCGIGIKEFESALSDELKIISGCTMSLVFINRLYEADSVTDEIREIFSKYGVRFIAMSSHGEICNGEIFHRTITAILFNCSSDAFHIIAADVVENNSFKAGLSAGKKALEFFENPSVLLFGTGNSSVVGDDLVAGIKSSLPDNAAIYGGFAAQDLSAKPTWIFTKNFYTGSGIAAVIFNSDMVKLRGIAVSGWKEIGLPREVTRSEGYTLFEVDGVPVLQLYERYFMAKARSQQQFIRAVSGYPLIVIKPDGSRVLRSIINVDLEKGGVIYGGRIPEGSRILFTAPDVSNIVEPVVDEVLKFYKKGNHYADALLIFSCVTRPFSLGDQLPEETRGINQIWNVPSAGFLTYGEIGAAAGCGTDFHNNTVSIVEISDDSGDENEMIDDMIDEEKDEEDNEKIKVKHDPALERILSEKNILSNFLQRTTEDLSQAIADLEKERARSK